MTSTMANIPSVKGIPRREDSPSWDILPVPGSLLPITKINLKAQLCPRV